MIYPSKPQLLESGKTLIEKFCVVNDLELPELRVRPSSSWPFSACAFYRPVYIAICVEKCASVGVAGMAWSYPGNTVDRTPYGALAHELGHHVDHHLSKEKAPYGGEFSHRLMVETEEAKLTNYCPNHWEWFAEMFRLFVTNPDLLSLIRPKTHAALLGLFEPVVTQTYAEVLREAPERTRIAVEKKVKEATRNVKAQSRVPAEQQRGLPLA